jgi:iron complex outermembrane receptor protein
MPQGLGLMTGGTLLAYAFASAPALAQRASENAVTNADDAFGTNVGLEVTGIYTENDTRGFSPLKAGNSRLDGVYFDPVAVLANRLKAGSAIRVGFAAEDYPFQAPTGIVDNRLRPWPTELGASIGATHYPYGGYILDLDLRVPIVKDHIGVIGGISASETRMVTGQQTRAWGVTVRPFFRIASWEVAPFAAMSKFTSQLPQPIVVLNGDFVPAVPEKRRYIGQEWAKGRSDSNNFGVNVKGNLASNLSLRAGLFRSEVLRKRNFSEVFTVLDPSGLSSHRFISDPPQDVYSTSGEAQLAYRFATGTWQHRIIAGFRGRDRNTDFGGSDSTTLKFADAPLGTIDPKAEPLFSHTPVNVGRVRQSAFMIGYIGKLAGLGVINLGLQRARYRADSFDAVKNVTTTTRESAWLYNATIGVPVTDHISVYVGTERGLEDSGAAPESAVNRNEQLPATRATQYEAGVRWKFPAGQLAVNAFQITKPYFTFDAARFYSEQGVVRHRGVEGSLSGTFFDKRLSLLAGAVLMQPRVSGLAVDQGIVGERPAGTPSLYARLDANYRTDIFGGLTPTISVIYTGERAVGSRPQATLGGKQLMMPGYAVVDLGLRQQFHLGKVSASFRFVVHNVFDHATWRVLAANTVQMEERRRVTATIAADF